MRYDQESAAGPATLMFELVQLERREREVSLVRRKLHDRIDRFPNDVARTQEREVSAERRDLHRRIDALRSLLGTLNDHS